VAAVLAFVPRWVAQLAQRYNAFGPEALGDQRRRNGRAAGLLTEEVLAALAERVKAPPEDGGVWSGRKVAAWMARQLGLAKVHPQRGREALKRIEWSLQAPRPRHARARGDARAAGGVQKGLEAAIAQARAEHPDRPVEVRAEDGHRLGPKPIRRRVRAPVGARPVASSSTARPAPASRHGAIGTTAQPPARPVPARCRARRTRRSAPAAA
jgi:hypothetical protein